MYLKRTIDFGEAPWEIPHVLVHEMTTGSESAANAPNPNPLPKRRILLRDRIFSCFIPNSRAVERNMKYAGKAQIDATPGVIDFGRGGWWHRSCVDISL